MLVVGLFIVGLTPINVIWHGDYWDPLYVFVLGYKIVPLSRLNKITQ